MFFSRNSRWASVLCVALAVAGMGAFGQLQAQTPDLTIRVDHDTVCPGTQNVPIGVYMSNPNDSVVAFEMWVQLDRPDIMVFQTELDTFIDTSYWQCLEWSGPVCVDSLHVPDWEPWDFFHIDTSVMYFGHVDTTGTLISGWEFLSARSLGGMGTDLDVVGMARQFGPADSLAIPPQQDGLLLKMIADVFDPPDTMTDRTANILVQTDLLQHFCFSDPQGNCIGLTYDTIPDTTFWVCLEWLEDSCLQWAQVSTPPYDSISIDWIVDPVLNVDIENGSVTIMSALWGDIDMNGRWDIGDLVYLVDWFFNGGPEPTCPFEADCNGDGEIDISDLVCWVENIFTP